MTTKSDNEKAAIAAFFYTLAIFAICLAFIGIGFLMGYSMKPTYCEIKVPETMVLIHKTDLRKLNTSIQAINKANQNPKFKFYE